MRIDYIVVDSARFSGFDYMREGRRNARQDIDKKPEAARVYGMLSVSIMSVHLAQNTKFAYYAVLTRSGARSVLSSLALRVSIFISHQ
jgi:hypothetical protein